MVKVFIAGANGYIGYPAAQALVRAGHQVFGLTRSQEVAKKFTADEIVPIIGEATSPQAWIDQVKDVDVVIDTAGGNEIATICKILYDAFHEVARTIRPYGPPLTYIYTSGAWIHGDDTETVYNDFSPLTHGIPLTAWRIPHERLVTSTKTPFIQGVVVRPSLVYGRSASLLGALFEPVKDGKVQWYGAPGGRMAMVHQDDLADLFVRVVGKAPIIGGLSFVAANPESDSWDFILTELCKIAGAKEIKYLPVENPFHHALGLSQRFNVSLARDLLGWMPRKRTLSDGLAQYYAAWQASQ